MRLRKITVKGFIRFVRKFPGKYPTVGGRTTFSVKPEREGVSYYLRSGKKYGYAGPANLGEYVRIFNKHRDYLTSSYSSRGDPHFRSSYFLGVVKQMQEGRPSIKALLNEISEEEKEILDAPRTERKNPPKGGIGQGAFGPEVIRLRKCCCVTGLSSTKFLRASHIKPWSESTNEERLDPANGLLLCPNYDYLFDQAFITFLNNGKMLISRELTPTLLTILGIDHARQAHFKGKRTNKYMAYHRVIFWKKQKSVRFKWGK